jgi:predicted RNA-binding protein (TIGR00451 family)
MGETDSRIECQLAIKKANYWVVRKLRMIADYQFSAGAGVCLFPVEIDASVSRKTGKVKEIRGRGNHIGTLNPRSGTFSLSLEGARRLQCRRDSPRVIVKNQFVLPISKGGNVFAKHLVEADESIRAGSEVIVLSEDSALIAVGHSLLSGDEAKRFKRGIAIKVRRGVSAHDVSKNGP